MKREPILFVVVLLILGLMTYNLLQEEAPRAAKVTGKKNLESFTLPEGDPVVSLLSEGSSRDLLRRPSADEPLAPLSLPDPEVSALAVLLPPPIPDSGSSYWSDHLFQQEPSVLGGLEDLVETGAESEGLSGFEESAEGAFEDQDDQYTKVYDWVRLDPLSTLYGHLLGEERFDYKRGSVLKFKQINPYSGKEASGEIFFNPDEYEDFGFADTLRNRIELGVRDQRSRLSAARVEDLRQYVRWLLDQGLTEPVAFPYAEELAREAVRLAGNDVASWMLLGEVWERTFELDRAFALYATLAGEELEGTMPDFGLTVESGRFDRVAGPRVRMGMILRRIGLDADAEGLLRDAVALNSGDAKAPMELGILLLDAGQVEEAAQHLSRAMAMQGQRNSAAGLRNALALGHASLRGGAWADAIEAYGNAERAAGNEEDAAMEAQAGLIAAHYLSGEFSTARGLAEEAITRFGADAKLLYLRGITEGADGGAAGEVIRDLRASAAATPFDAAPALSAQAFWLDRIGETELAQEALANALELAPEHLYSRYLKAHWSARDGDLSSAREALQNMVRIAPSCAAILAEYGSLLYAEGSYSRAEVAFRGLEAEFPAWVGSSTKAPAWAGMVLRHGLNLLKLGQLEEAMSAFDQCISMDPTLAAARNAKGIVLYREGDLDASVAEFAYLQDALREEEQNPQYQYAAAWGTRILDHAKLRRWIDLFDGSRLRPGWDKQTGARAGVEPRLQDQLLTIQGDHGGAAETRVFRTVAGAAFRSYEADLLTGSGHRGEASVFIALQNRSKETWSFHVIRDREGAVKWNMMRGTRSEDGNTSLRIPEGALARVSFQVDREPKQPVLTVRVDGEVIFTEPVANLRNPTGMMAMGLAAKTAHALPVEASLDNVALVYAIP